VRGKLAMGQLGDGPSAGGGDWFRQESWGRAVEDQRVSSLVMVCRVPRMYQRGCSAFSRTTCRWHDAQPTYSDAQVGGRGVLGA
jgi:hypothetical protein